MKKLYFILLLLLPGLTQAQSKFSLPTSLWPELQFNYGVGEDGMLFLHNQYRISTDSRYNGIGDAAERIEVSLGYEHTFSDHWRGGAVYRYAKEDFPTTNFYGLFVRHNGEVKGLYFNKQLMVEYTAQQGREAYGRTRLMVELGKRLPLGNKFISPGISYEAMLLSEFGSDDDIDEKKRVVDRTRLRLSLNYELTEKLRINPYFMRQTDRYYVIVPPEYDEDGLLLKDSYTTKRNRITPVIGLELKYTINRTPETASFTY